MSTVLLSRDIQEGVRASLASLSSQPKERKEMVCDCRRPARCGIKYHLTEKARAQLLPDKVNHFKNVVTGFAKSVDRVKLMRQPALHAWVLQLAEAAESLDRYLPRDEHRRAA